MAGEDNGKLTFQAIIDDSSLEDTAYRAIDILKNLGKAAQEEGQSLDDAFDVDAEPLKRIASVADEVFRHLLELGKIDLSDLGGSLDTASTEQKIEILRKAILEINDSIGQSKKDFNALGEEARQAFASGDMERFDAISKSMEDLSESMSEAHRTGDAYAGVMLVLEESLRNADEAIDDVNKDAERQATILEKLLGGSENYRTIMENLPAPIKNAADGISSMVKAAKAFIATPLGAAISAITLAVKAMSEWFNSSVAGQLRFAEISGYLSGVLGQLKEIVISVGKSLVEAFENPKEAMKSFWETLKSQVVNRLEAVGKMGASLAEIFSSAFKFDGEGAKRGLRDLGDSFLQLTTGVEDSGRKIREWAQSVNDAGKETGEIRRQSRELEMEIAEWQIVKERLDYQKQEARMRMYDTSLSQAERQEALNAYKDVINKELEKEKEIADRKIELQERQMALTTNSIEDENELRRLKAERERIETQAMSELAMLQRSSNSIMKGASEEQKAAEELKEFMRRNQEEQISLMEEGSKKKIAQIEYDYEREIEALREQEKKWREAQNGELVEAQRVAVEEATRIAGEKREREIVAVQKEELDSAIADFMTYEQKRYQISKDYAEKRAKLYVDDDESNGLREGITHGNIAELERQREETMNALDEQFARREVSFEAWCNQIAQYSLTELEKVLEEAQKELERLESEGVGDTQEMAVARAKVAQAQERINKANAQKNAGPGKMTVRQWKDLYDVLNECNGQFADMADQIGGLAGQFLSVASQIASSTIQIIQGIQQLVTTSSQTMQGTATAASRAISTVEKASVILTIISAAMQVIMKVVEAFNTDEAKNRQIQMLQSQITQLKWEMDNLDVIRIQDQYGKAIDNAAKAYEKFNDALFRTLQGMSVSQWIKWTNDADKAKELMLKYSVDLTNMYANVAYTADKALGEERFRNVRKELEYLSAEQLNLYRQIEVESSKKKKKRDDDLIADLERQLQEAAMKSVSLINDFLEEIIGGSAIQISNELADAFIDAFRAGEDAAEAWGDKVNDIVANVMKQMLVNKFLEERIGVVFDAYKERWFNDGILSTDAVIGSMSDFAEDLNEVGDQFAEIWENLPDSVKNTFSMTSDAEREALTKGIATASQDSVDELNGRMTAVQGHTYAIAENAHSLVNLSTSILQSVVAIEGDTRDMRVRISAVETGVRNMESTISDMYIKGIKIKDL